MIRSIAVCLTFASLTLLTTPVALADECEDCHSSSVFKVKYKLLYDHHVGYENSVHRLVGLSCVDCHGGDAGTRDKDLAHVGVRDQVREQRIPATCGACHTVQYDAFTGSEHFEATAGERDALHCVTCHGSMEMDVTFVGRVHRKCMKCHEDSDAPESVDVRANDVLSRINTLLGYLSLVRATISDAEMIAEINTVFDRLVRQWHDLDLDGADTTSRELLDLLRRAKASSP